MNRRRLLPFAIVFGPILAASCSAPDGTRTARDIPDETPERSKPDPQAEKGAIPLADRMRNVDKTVYRISVDELPQMGPSSAPLTIVLFSDYECPFCRKLEPVLAKLRADNPSDVRVVLAPRPLPFHQNAKPAALAVLAAASQGKLEAMHERVVALDGKLDNESILSAARAAGLDLARFEADRAGPDAEKILARATELATRFSVQGTPTVFVNGRRVTGAIPDVIRELASQELILAREVQKQGIDPHRIYETIIAKGQEKADPDVATPRLFGDHRKLTVEQMNDMWKCVNNDKDTSPSIEIVVGPSGTVARVESSNASLGACIKTASSGWKFDSSDTESKVKLSFKK